MRSAAVETMLIMTPQAARPASTPPCDAPAQAPMVKMASLPYVDARDQSGFFSRPTLSSAAVHVFTKKNPRSPAETFREGMIPIPVVRLSFMTMTLNIAARTKLTTKARSVSCSRHPGTRFPSNTLSTDIDIIVDAAASPFPSRVSTSFAAAAAALRRRISLPSGATISSSPSPSPSRRSAP
ncbi:hypothetical protein ACMD2_08441 [Ananas comosus]|uniref:Uncharacterized protein n=1 Tax=Ananas comosus TaxID=4615 RepID=A0A199VNK8_ANACO|nr:hypothetical protein ACMD2_08441 [Ananas comosus]